MSPEVILKSNDENPLPKLLLRLVLNKINVGRLVKNFYLFVAVAVGL